MAKVIKFPVPHTRLVRSGSQQQRIDIRQPFVPSPSVRQSSSQRLLHGCRVALWVVVVATMPIWRWIAVLDLIVQSLRVLVFWQTPGAHAGSVLLLHLVGFGALAVFVLWSPKEVL